MERTLVLIKPDGVERGLIGEIISFYEKKGLKIAAIKGINPTVEQAENHYEEHKDKHFFKSLVDYLCSGMLVAMIVEGENAVSMVRRINGDKDLSKCDLGSIRGKYALSKEMNLVHASDSIDSAEREIKIWFNEIKAINVDKVIKEHILKSC